MRIVVALCFLFALAYAGVVSQPISCQSARNLGGYPFSFTQQLVAGAVNTLTRGCIELGNSVGQVWARTIFSQPADVTYRLCTEAINLDVSLTLEATGFTDCINKDPSPSFCINDITGSFSSQFECQNLATVQATLIPGIPYYVRVDGSTPYEFVLSGAASIRPELIPINDECQGARSITTLPFVDQGSTTIYATVSSFPCSRSPAPVGDIWYRFENIVGTKDIAACALWDIEIFLLPITTQCSIASEGRTATEFLRDVCESAQTAQRGSDGCARLTTTDVSGYVVVSGSSPFSRGNFALSINPPPTFKPVIVCPHDLVKNIDTCSYSGTTGTPSVIPLSGNPVTIRKSPRGPYPVGETPITFTVNDGEQSSSCVQKLTVITTATNCVRDF